MTNQSSKTPVWVRIVAGLGLVWNLVGAMQFVRNVTSTADDLLAQGMTAAQAQVMTSFPVWVDGVFLVGVVTSILGCVFLFIRHKWTGAALGAQMVAFVLLWIAYAIYGAYAALGMAQIMIMSTVAIIAIALYIVARIAMRPDRG